MATKEITMFIFQKLKIIITKSKQTPFQCCTILAQLTFFFWFIMYHHSTKLLLGGTARFVSYMRVIMFTVHYLDNLSVGSQSGLTSVFAIQRTPPCSSVFKTLVDVKYKIVHNYFRKLFSWLEIHNS